MSLRIVNLGLPKTGTTTLGRALKSGGLTVADHRIRPKQTNDPELQDRFVGELIYSGYFETGDPAGHLPGFDAIAEMSCLRAGHSMWPQMDYGVIMAIRDQHPGVKFLASNRDPFELSQSMLAWSDLGLSRLPSGAIPGLPPGFGETTKQRIMWIEAHYAHLRAIFRDDPAFLEFDINDPGAPDKIAAHTAIDIQWWGQANRNRAFG